MYPTVTAKKNIMRIVLRKQVPSRVQSGSRGKLDLIEAPIFNSELGFVASWMKPVGQVDPATMTAKIVYLAGYLAS
jgi:hypothetical protein